MDSLEHTHKPKYILLSQKENKQAKPSYYLFERFSLQPYVYINQVVSASVNKYIALEQSKFFFCQKLSFQCTCTLKLVYYMHW